MHYRLFPIWKDNSDPRKRFFFVGDDTIVRTKFNTLSDAIEFAKLDGTALREQNWKCYQCDGWLFKTEKRISLKTLQEMGFLATETTSDSISEIYLFKQ